MFLHSASVPSCSVMSNSLQPRSPYLTRLLCPWDSPGKNTGVGCHALLQGLFPTQESNPGLLQCRRILYCLNHQGSPRILECVTISFSRGSSRARNQTRVSCTARGFFTSGATSCVPSQLKNNHSVFTLVCDLMSLRGNFKISPAFSVNEGQHKVGSLPQIKS